MLTIECLLAELVSQFLLDINPRVHRFVFGEMSTHTFVKVNACSTTGVTQLLLSTHGCHPCQDCGIPLGYLEICPHSTAVNVWTTDVGKWLHCCIGVNNPLDQFYEAIDDYGINVYEKSARPHIYLTLDNFREDAVVLFDIFFPCTDPNGISL